MNFMIALSRFSCEVRVYEMFMYAYIFVRLSLDQMEYLF